MAHEFDESLVMGVARLRARTAVRIPWIPRSAPRPRKKVASDLPKLIKFTPFDPGTKMSEATAAGAGGATLRAVKGAFAAVAALTPSAPDAESKTASDLEAQGFRVLAVAVGPPAALKLAEIIALSDPPRPDSAALIAELHSLGVRAVIVTGDAPATAAIVAHAVGPNEKICPPGPIPADVRPEEFAVFAGILPEGKYNLVKGFQKSGHIVGMCGDAPSACAAMRQRRAGASAGPDGNRSLYCHRRCQVGRQPRADQTRTRRDRRLGKRRPRDLPAYPDLRVKVRHEESARAMVLTFL
jgi:H+-transporting ATPase